MSWSYSGDPATSPKDAVRFLVGDILEGDHLREDEEIAWTLTESGSNIYLAVALICESLAAQFSREADESREEVRTALSQRAAAFRSQAAAYRARATQGLAGIVGVAPFLGGASQSRQDTEIADTEFLQPAFRPRLFDDGEAA